MFGILEGQVINVMMKKCVILYLCTLDVKCVHL